MKLKQCFKSFLDIIFPIECLGCGEEGQWLCGKCLSSIPLVNRFICPICNRPALHGRPCPSCQRKSKLDNLWVACSYQNQLLKKAIKTLKYRKVKELAKPLASLMIKLLEDLKNQEWTLTDFLIMPIPLYPYRQRSRGFNQAELLAEEIAKKFNLKLVTDVLKRVKITASQAKLASDERRDNVKDAFKVVDKEGMKNRKIILVDDLTTTGATLQEAARILKKAGAKSVIGLALARG
jgi:ComF family protein